MRPSFNLTGLAFEARSIGGAFGSAVLDAIISGQWSSIYATKAGHAAVNAGRSNSSIAQLLEAFTNPTPEALQEVPGLNQLILQVAESSSYDAYRQAYWPLKDKQKHYLIEALCITMINYCHAYVVVEPNNGDAHQESKAALGDNTGCGAR